MLAGSDIWKRPCGIERVLIVLGAALAFVAAGLWARLGSDGDAAYTHLAYVPIVLAALWFGLHSLYVAGALAGVTLLLGFSGECPGSVWADACRGALFVVVALCVAVTAGKMRSLARAVRVSVAGGLSEDSAAGVVLYRGGHILFASARLGAMLGYEAPKMVGMSIWDLYHEDDRARALDLVALREKGLTSALHYECRLVRRDGAVIWADVASCVVNLEGEPAVLLSAYDITDRKESETKRRELSELAKNQEEQLVHSTRLAELGEMAASIAHELNQPLTGIRNFAKNALYMLEDGAGSLEDAGENLRLITEQVDRASKIINQMRQLARRTERQFDPVDLNAIVGETVEFLMPQLRLAGVEVNVSLAQDLPQSLGDRVRLEQVFLNLLTNAKQAMEDVDEPRLRIRTYLDPQSDCPIGVEIQDTGKGFAQEDVGKLFAPFFSTKRAGHGTGLGLSISLSIVNDHKGSIEATGRPGEGATFRVRLPLNEVDQGRQREDVHE